MDIDDEKSEVHKWFAITLGSKGEYLSVKEKIADGFLFKQHLDRALQLAPEDATIHHLMGRFCYEVSSMSESFYLIAKAIFNNSGP